MHGRIATGRSDVTEESRKKPEAMLASASGTKKTNLLLTEILAESRTQTWLMQNLTVGADGTRIAAVRDVELDEIRTRYGL